MVVTHGKDFDRENKNTAFLFKIVFLLQITKRKCDVRNENVMAHFLLIFEKDTRLNYIHKLSFELELRRSDLNDPAITLTEMDARCKVSLKYLAQ